jgi:hypothetical protein
MDLLLAQLQCDGADGQFNAVRIGNADESTQERDLIDSGDEERCPRGQKTRRLYILCQRLHETIATHPSKRREWPCFRSRPSFNKSLFLAVWELAERSMPSHEQAESWFITV